MHNLSEKIEIVYFALLTGTVDTGLSRLLIVPTVQMTVLLEYFDNYCVFIRVQAVVKQSSVYKSMGFTYPDYFTYLNIFVIELAHRCSDNGEITVLTYKNLRAKSNTSTLLSLKVKVKY